MKEIVTVQVGRFANFVGSHFWNFQDEVLGLAEQGYEGPMIPTVGLNMDVIFRVGETRQGRPTYTPRLLSLDLRGSLGAVSSSGSLYGRPPCAETTLMSTWHGPAETFRSEPYEKNKFLQSLDDEEERWLNKDAQGQLFTDPVSETSAEGSHGEVHMYEKERVLVQSLEEGVQFWTDYLKTDLHPSSLYQIPGLWEGVTPFGDYGCGKGLLSGVEQAEDIRDKVRLFVEECDHMQGFQFLVDDSGGFAAVAADLLDDIVEDYGRTPIFLFNVRPPDELGPPIGSLTWDLHNAVSLARLSSVAHVTVPLGLPQISQSAFAEHLRIQDGKHFHSSALYAAAINSITLPFRMEDSRPSVTTQVEGVGSTDIGTSLRLLSCSFAKRVALMEATFPAPAVPDSGSGQAYGVEKLSSLTPSSRPSMSGDQIAEMLVIQGARLTGSRGPAPVSQVLESLAGVSGRVAHATNPRRGLVSSHFAVSPCPMAIPLPFPCIFSPYIGRYGDILSRPVVSTVQGRGGLDVVSSPMMTRVSTSEAILPFIRKRWDDIRRLGLARSTAGSLLLENWGFAREEVQELVETLSGMLHAYADTTETDSSDNE